MKYYQRPEFRYLQFEWDKKLKDSGFIDHEVTIGSDRSLKKYALKLLSREVQLNKEAKEEYYHAISCNVLSHNFDRDIDKSVMVKFSEGLTHKEIVLFVTNQGKKIHRKTVMFIIRRHEHIWGMKYWTAKQRKLKNG